MAYVINAKFDGQTPVCLEIVNAKKSTQYPLREVTPLELAQHRLSKKPGIVYKKNGKLYYTSFPATLKIYGQDDTLGTHLCGKNCDMICKGCRRTSDLTVPYQERYGKKFVEAVKASWRIEKYPFITEGIEAFNMISAYDALLVLECENFKVREPKKKNSSKSLHELKLGLAEFFWDDFDGSLTDMRRRINAQSSNKNNYTYTPPGF